MKTRYYVGKGHRSHGGGMFVFTSKGTPTSATHGYEYASVIGPFRTKWGAMVMARYGENNPHIQTVTDAERIAARERKEPSGRFPDLYKQAGFSRKANPLPAVRKVYYVVHAHKPGSKHERFWLRRSGKLTKRRADAARFTTAKEAIAKAKAHLAQYPASRSYRFDICLAY